MFYQGIDKVSRVIETPVSPDDEALDDTERGGKGEGGEDVGGEGGGDGTTEPAEDSPAKEDDELDENGDGEKHEMTDEELAARCRYCVLCRWGILLILLSVRCARSGASFEVVEYYEARQSGTQVLRRCSVALYHVERLTTMFLYAAHALFTSQVCRIG